MVLIVLFCLVNFVSAQDNAALLKKAEGQKGAGIAMTFIGVGCQVVGGVVMVMGTFSGVSSGLSGDLDGLGSGIALMYTGYGLIGAGSVLECIGVPFWIVGGIKAGKIKRTMKVGSLDTLQDAEWVFRPLVSINPKQDQLVSLGLEFSF
jgi:hypothetical protein